MNHRAENMIRWLLAGHGGLKNVARMLTDAFGPGAVIAATVDISDGAITAYPKQPDAGPVSGNWTQVPNGWRHAFDPPSMPHSATAEHHVVVGITSRDELLIVNLEAAEAVGVGGEAVPVMRSWLMQVLSKTPTAEVVVDDTALALEGGPRLHHVDDPADTPPSATVYFTTTTTPRGSAALPITVSAHTDTHGNALLLDAEVAGIYVGNRYWPLWRYLHLNDDAWSALSTTVTGTSTPDTPSLAAVEPPSDSIATPPKPQGLYALGNAYVLGQDPETGELVMHGAVTRMGARKPVEALMALATSGGLTTAEWDQMLDIKPANRRQLRTQIRRMFGGADPVTTDPHTLLNTDLYCDWKEFQQLVGHDPFGASTENLTAAVALIRGAPFADIPGGAYQWRSAILLKDRLIDLCADAALELARRQSAAGDAESAHRTARVGLQVYPLREDLWEMAVQTVSDEERAALGYDLMQAIDSPQTPELKALLARSRVQTR
ncbi:AfsR/SARP family transcriptional regulator [Mycolicibacterium sp. XJ870]